MTGLALHCSWLIHPLLHVLQTRLTTSSGRRAIDSPRSHPQIRATLLLHGSGSNKAAGQPAWPDVLTGVSWTAAENTFARHGDTSWCASSPKFRDNLPEPFSPSVQYTRQRFRLSGSLVFDHCAVCTGRPGADRTDTGTHLVLTLIGRLVVNRCHAKSSEGGPCGACVPRPEPIPRQDAHVPQGGRL
jgi:hypothetical protein